MESFRRYIDYQKLYYIRAKRAFMDQVEKAEGIEERDNYISKHRQAFDLVFETLAEQLKQEDKAIEKMTMRDYYHNGSKRVVKNVFLGDYYRDL
jgi:hypothetical protein